MKFIILGMFVALSANAGIQELCGYLEQVSNHEFSYGRVEVIGLSKEDGGKALLYDKRDLEASVEVLIGTEGVRANPDNVNFSHNEYGEYYLFTNYQLRNRYYACAQVIDADGPLKYRNSLSFKLYLLTMNGGKLLYSRSDLD